MPTAMAAMAGDTRPSFVDWSEQQHHLAGRLGAALLDHALEAEWVRRTHNRAVRLTETGRHALRTDLGMDLLSSGH